MRFFLRVLIALKSLEVDERSTLVNSSSAFDDWLDSIDEAQTRQLRHMLLFLLFPDDFERVFSAGERKAIEERFSGLSRGEINSLSAVQLDRKLRETRRRLETEYGRTDLDFYLSPLKERWQRDLGSVVASITAEHVKQALREIDRDGIPIQNIYYLLCYAWDQLEQGALVDVDSVPSTELADLFARVLCDGVEHLAKRGFEQGYELIDEEIAGVRGKINFSVSARRSLFSLGRAQCEFDELTSDTRIAMTSFDRLEARPH